MQKVYNLLEVKLDFIIKITEKEHRFFMFTV